MATVTKALHSGEGNMDGLSGTKATELYYCELDSANIDSVTGEPDDPQNPLSPMGARFPQGQKHETAQNVTVVDIAQERWLKGNATKARWEMRVIYGGVKDTIGLSQKGWLVSYNTSLETEKMVRDLDGLWIGGHGYRFPQSGDFPLPPGGVFTAQTIRGDRDVIQLPEGIVDPQPLNRFVPMTSFSLRATVADLSVRQVKAADNFVGLVSSEPFVTGDTYEILIAPLRIDQINGNAETGSTHGILYELELNFLRKRGGWRYDNVFDQFEYEGYRGSIVDAGKPVFQRFRKYDKASPDALLAIFQKSLVTEIPLPKPAPGPRRGP